MNKNAEIISKKLITLAFKFHSQGDILQAAKYYQQFIDQGFKDHSITFFSRRTHVEHRL